MVRRWIDYYAIGQPLVRACSARPGVKAGAHQSQSMRKVLSMSLLDAHIPQLVASQSAFGAKAGLMRSTIGQAEHEAMSSQAFFAGDGAAAFQAAHARFVAAAAQGDSLVGIAQANLADAAGTYVAADSAAASSYPGF